jgi:ketosteroid isomerase-like protein
MKAVVEKYYEAFGRRDWQTIGKLYADSIFFSDPAFPKLHGDEARAMWKMLMSRASDDFRIELLSIEEHPDHVIGEMIAHYTFSQTKRKVANRIKSTFVVKDGLIIRQHDRFSFWGWAKQAFGPVGLAMGWSWPFKTMVRRKVAEALAKFTAR